MNGKNLVHHFDSQVAAVYGIQAALIFQYIAWRSDNTPERWVSLTVDSVCKQYPYLGRKGCWKAMKLLISPTRKTPAIVHRKPTSNGLAFLYAPACKDHSCQAPRYFDVGVATRLGIVPALIYFNIGHWTTKNWKETALLAYEELDPEKFKLDGQWMQAFAWKHTRLSAAHHCRVEDWQKELNPYIPLRSVERGFSCLLEQGMLEKTYANSRIPVWRLPARMMNRFEAKFLDVLDLEDCSAKRKCCPPKGTDCRQKEMLSAKRKQESDVSDSDDMRWMPFESSLEALVSPRHTARRVKPLGENFTASDQPSLADARSDRAEGAEGASRNLSVDYERTLLQKIKHLNAHAVPIVEAKMGKRDYNRKPRPASPDDLNIMDEMTLEEWKAWQASLR